MGAFWGCLVIALVLWTHGEMLDIHLKKLEQQQVEQCQKAKP